MYNERNFCDNKTDISIRLSKDTVLQKMSSSNRPSFIKKHEWFTKVIRRQFVSRTVNTE